MFENRLQIAGLNMSLKLELNITVVIKLYSTYCILHGDFHIQSSFAISEVPN